MTFRLSLVFFSRARRSGRSLSGIEERVLAGLCLRLTGLAECGEEATESERCRGIAVEQFMQVKREQLAIGHSGTVRAGEAETASETEDPSQSQKRSAKPSFDMRRLSTSLRVSLR